MLARIGVISFAPFSKRRASRVSQKTKAKRTVLLIYQQQQQLQLLLDGSIVVYHFTLLIIIIGERVHNEMEKSLFATQIIYNGNRGSLLIPIKTVIRYFWGGLKMFVHCNSELLKSLKPTHDHFYFHYKQLGFQWKWLRMVIYTKVTIKYICIFK